MHIVKRVITIIVLFFVCGTTLSIAQPSWEAIGNVKFRACQKLPDHRVCVVTSAGYILWSTDDGNSWAHQTLNSAISLNGVAFSNDLIGLITTDSNIIFRTTNAGLSWSTTIIPTVEHLNSIVSLSKDSFFVCGTNGLCLISSDGGLNWKSSGPKTTANLKKCIFQNSLEGYITADSGFLFHTINSGLSWDRLPTPFVTPITCFDRSPGGKIVIGSDTALLATSYDNGLTWNRRKATLSVTSDISLAKFINEDTIVAFQNNYYRFISINAGKSWDSIYINTPFENEVIRFVEYYDAWRNDKGEFMMVADESTVYSLNPDGFTGRILSHYGVIAARLPFFEFTPNSDSHIHGIANTLNNAFVSTTDRGYTWITRQEPTFSNGSHIGLHFTNDSTGIIFTGQGQSKFFDAPTVTTNNGISWTNFSISQLPHKAWQLFKHSPNGALYIFSDSVIFSSSDNGYHWSSWGEYTVPSDSGNPSNISRIDDASFFGDEGINLLVKFLGAGTIQNYFTTSTDAGKTWKTVALNTQGNFLKSMAFVGLSKGFIVGTNGFVLYTTDNGNSWSPLSLGTASLLSISFNANSTLGVIGGDSSMIYMTTDSGSTWKGEKIIANALPENSRFSKTVFLNDTTVFAECYGVVLRRTFPKPSNNRVDGNTKSAQQYLFVAPYPNPATSTIAHCRLFGLYAVDKLSIRVNLIDILGRNIVDLTSQAIQSANNSISTVDIDISGLPTGTYFVSLTSSGGSFIAPLLILH